LRNFSPARATALAGRLREASLTGVKAADSLGGETVNLDWRKEDKMRLLSALVVGGLSLASLAGPAMATSCYDLWYQRNAIFDENGYCFKTELGQQTFDNSDCWTDTPQLSKAEQKRVDAIRKEERRRGCHVN
jgi:hypothetical protein